MFYDNFLKLCAKKGVSQSGAAKAIGLSNAAASGWKSGKQPSDVTLEKLALYFGVSVDELTADTEKAPTNEGERDDELTEYLDMLRNRPECRMLFSLAKGATKEDIERAVAIIEALREKEGR